jgi:hypothetical protein
MTAIYVTVDDIESRLRTTFGTATEPTEAQITTWIEDAQDYIDELAGRTWQGSFTATNEYQDYNGENIVVVQNPGLLTVTTLEYTANNGVSWTAIPSTAYEVYSDYDSIEFKPDSVTGSTPSIPRGQKKIRLTYTYGASSVPPRIKRLAEDMVVLDTIESLISSSANTQGGSVQVGPIRVDDPGMFSLNAVKGIESSVSRRLDALSSSRIRTSIGKNFL